MIKPLLHVAIFSLSLPLAACTVSPRTGIQGPQDNQDDQLAHDSAHAGTAEPGDGFHLPQAQPIERAPRGTAESDAPSEPPGLKLGLADIQLGPRPPFASLPALAQIDEQAAQRESPLGTVWSHARTIVIGEGYLYESEFSPDGTHVYTLSGNSGTIYEHDLSSGQLLRKIPIPNFSQFDDASFTVLKELPQQPQLLVTRPSGTSVLDLASARFEALEQAPGGDSILHFRRFGLYGVGARSISPQSGELFLKWVDGTLAAHLRCDERPDDYSLTADGRYLAVQYFPSNRVELYDLKDQNLALSVASPKWGGSVAIAADGSLLALGGEKLVVISLPDGRTIFEDTDFGNNIDRIAFTKERDLLLVSAYDGKARSYALAADLVAGMPAPKPQLLRHNGSANVYSVSLSSDERQLITSSGDQTIRIWRR